MTYGSLFAGAGGFDLGFDLTGFRCLWQVEIDRTARDVLARHWPDVERFEDVRKCGKRNLSPVDVVVGGFPCTDLSVAGNRAGLKGEHSGLFYDLARVARELRPGFLVWENVSGLLSSDDGRDFARVLRHLADSGYFGCWRVLDAEGFGVAQTRRRVFGVFARGRAGIERCAEILALTESVSRDTPSGRQAGAEIAGTLGGGTPGRGWSDDIERCGAFIPIRVGTISGGQHPDGFNGQDVGNLIAFGGNDTRGPRRPAAGLNGRTGGRQDFETETFVVGQCHGSDVGAMGSLRRGNGSVTGGVPFIADGYGVRRMTPLECERVMGWPDGHTEFRANGRRIADGPRYRLIGNGVVGTVSEWLAKRLMQYGFAQKNSDGTVPRKGQ